MKEEAPRSTSWINIVLTLIWQSAWNHHKLYFFTFACFHPILRWEPTVEILRDAINCVVSPGIVNLIQTDSGIVAHAFPSRQCHCQMSLHNKLWSCFNNSPFPPLLTALSFNFIQSTTFSVVDVISHDWRDGILYWKPGVKIGRRAVLFHWDELAERFLWWRLLGRLEEGCLMRSSTWSCL